MTDEEKKSWAVGQLMQKSTELGRVPQKDDFEVMTLSRIKAFLGPWPRALEAAGLKPGKENGRRTRKKRKRKKNNEKN